MLSIMRRSRKHLNWVLWLVILGLAAGMVMFFVDIPGGGSGPAGVESVAEVEGNPITVKEFRQNYQRMFDVYRQAYNLNSSNAHLLRSLGLEKQVLNQLIASEVILLEADRMGITATDE